MKHATLLTMMVIFSCGLAYGQKSRLTAKAELQDPQGKKVGVARLIEAKEGVKITLNASHLPPGNHALHIHAVGECLPPDFMSAGPHLNPFGKKHGMKNPAGPHAGDLPNFAVAKNGSAHVAIVAAHVSLKEGKNSLFTPDGTSLVIHANPDDEQTDPAGNAGARIACGVILKGK